VASLAWRNLDDIMVGRSPFDNQKRGVNKARNLPERAPKDQPNRRKNLPGYAVWELYPGIFKVRKASVWAKPLRADYGQSHRTTVMKYDL
jgi:hypothetical protein